MNAQMRLKYIPDDVELLLQLRDKVHFNIILV